MAKSFLNLIGLDAGLRVRLSVDKGRLIIQPERKTRYTMAELLSRCRRSDLALRRSDRAWLATGPAGKELL